VFEGGSIESNGAGVLLTTEECLLSKERNPQFSKQEIENYLKEKFGAHTVLWLSHGFLAGDDTDSHIDTLARFVDDHTIAYVQCNDENDLHYTELQAMERELQDFRMPNGKPYRLLALPMTPPIFDEDGERLPATYANFLIINTAVLVPVYNCATDAEALRILQQAFPTREIVPIDCSVLITQHGSLHCVTMQFPER
jgi:agmatine/peptidylarginine deiminase